MTRLALDMHINDALFKMSEGNPGAINVIMDSIREGARIDPDSCFQEWSMIVNLDHCEVYGPRIWRLYKDLCKENLALSIAMLRGVQLGIISREELDDGINGIGPIDTAKVAERVKAELPDFQLS